MARGNAWIPFHVGDYLADTMHLDGPAHGAYLLLLFHYWRTGPLPDDDEALAAIARTSQKAWDKGIGPKVRAFFHVNAGLLYQKRMDAERAKVGQVSSIRSAVAHAGWEQRRSKSNAIASANAVGLQTHAGARQPEPHPEKEPLPSVEAPAAPAHGLPPKADAREVLWSEGVARMERLTGKSNKQARSLVGQMLAKLKDDCALASLLLHECEMARPGNPIEWLQKAVANRAGQAVNGVKSKNSIPDWTIEAIRNGAAGDVVPHIPGPATYEEYLASKAANPTPEEVP